MGAKQGKVKWSLKESDVESALCCTEEVMLDRSTAEDRKQNLMGLPEDVVALIAVYVAREDINSMKAVAQVCKTWRRVSYRDSVWRAIAKDRDVYLDDVLEGSVRSQLLQFLCPRNDDLLFFPTSISEAIGTTEFRFQHIQPPTQYSIRLMSFQSGVGKKKLGLCLENGGKGMGATLDENDVRLQSDFTKTLFPGIMASVRCCDTSDTCYKNEPTLRDGFFRDDDAGLIFVDTFDKEEIVDDLMNALERMMFVTSMSHEKLIVAIARTKSDLGLPFVGKMKILQFCKQYQIPFYCCSAKTGVNVEKMFMHICLLLKMKTLKK